VYELNLRVPLQPPGAYPLIVKAGGVASNITIVTVGGGSHHWLVIRKESARERTPTLAGIGVPSGAERTGQRANDPQYVFFCRDCHKEFTRIRHIADLENDGGPARSVAASA